MSRRRPLGACAAAGLALAGLACGGDPRRGTTEPPLFAAPAEVEVLVEAATVAPPPADGANRFHRGWRPAEAEGRPAYQTTGGDSGFEIVLLGAPAGAQGRTLAVDLAAAGPGGLPGHVEVRIDDRPPALLPVSDPLAIPLPADLAPGRHRVAIGPRSADDPPLVVFEAAVRPAPVPGAAGFEDGELVQTGPSMVDVPARPGAGAVLAGEVCSLPGVWGTGELAVEVEPADASGLVGWSGGGGLRALVGGCRAIELPPLATEGPVRVRFSALAPGSGARWRGWRWRDPRPAPPPAPETRGAPADPPRLVVLYLLDALRADAVGHLGGPPGATPVLDRLAREGHAFRAHRSTAPNTLLSLRHLFPGRIVVDDDAWRAVGSELPTLAERFRHAGYRTGLFSGNGYLAGPFGLDRGFDHVSEAALVEGGDAGVNRNAEAVHGAALGWLDGLPAGSRVFLYLHTVHPHNPYAPPPELERRFTAGIPSEIRGTTPVLRDLARGRRTASAADRDRLRGLYAASLAYNDAEIERLLAGLRERYDDGEMLWAVTSDHGEELFDHGGVLHGYTLYEELLRIPLVVWAPGRVPPGETAEPTDSLDLHATLVDLLGLGGGAAGGGGRSLLGRLAGGGEPAPGLRFAAADGVPGGAFAVRWGRFKYVWVRGNARTWAMGLGPSRTWDREYLFDLAADPGERRNLAGTGGVVETWLRGRLRGWVEERLAEGRDGEPGPAEPPLDEATERRLRALGYVD